MGNSLSKLGQNFMEILGEKFLELVFKKMSFKKIIFSYFKKF